MPQVLKTDEFDAWLRKLRDQMAANRILNRIVRMGQGNLGDVKPVGEGISEARIDYGPGYRLYFGSRGDELILLLIGGDKTTQDKDIATAKRLWKTWKDLSNG